jgi:predicted transcriptional regulator
MKRYNNLLTYIGLSLSERTIYLSLLQSPYQRVADLVRDTQYHRPMVYQSLRRLESEWLVDKSYLDGKRYHYHTTHPDKLREKVAHIMTIADTLIPELEEIHDRKHDTPTLSIKEWIEWIQAIHMDLVTRLPAGGIYYRYSSSNREYGKRSTYIPPEYFDMQKSKAIERCVISNEARKSRHSTNPNRDIVAVPSSFDLFDDNITKIIYEDTVAIIDYEAQMGWTIQSERFARYEEKIFRLLFKLIKEST